MSNLKVDFQKYPLLLHKSHPITKAIIWDLHIKKRHSGIYPLLNDLRKEFWILQHYSAVKNVLKHCVWCKRQNARTIKTNVNAYKEFRVNPDSIPFRDIMLDHIGPFSVKNSGKTEKVWVLIITCLYSRAVSLNICLSLDTSSFLRAFQMHILRYSLPKLVLGDPGSSIVSGVNVVIDFLNDFATRKYLEENGIHQVKFQTYPSGASWLGGMVETMVKQCKKLLNASIHRRLLSYSDFEYTVLESECLVNKRPIAFKDSLRDTGSDYSVLTPEMVVKGYSTVVVNVIPQLQSNPDDVKDKVWVADNEKCTGSRGLLTKNYEKLKLVKERIRENYHEEFLKTLIAQATDRKGRYTTVSHSKLNVGDLVCIKLPLSKPLQYPLGIVKSVKVNDLNETVSATVMKGNRQIVNKHVNELILLLKNEELHEPEVQYDDKDEVVSSSGFRVIPSRGAKVLARQKIAEMAGP